MISSFVKDERWSWWPSVFGFFSGPVDWQPVSELVRLTYPLLAALTVCLFSCTGLLVEGCLALQNDIYIASNYFPKTERELK